MSCHAPFHIVVIQLTKNGTIQKENFNYFKFKDNYMFV